MLACAAITWEKLLCSRLFRSRCIATDPHARVFKYPLCRLNIDDYSKTNYFFPHPYTITASALPTLLRKHVLLCVGKVKAVSSFTVILLFPSKYPTSARSKVYFTSTIQRFKLVFNHLESWDSAVGIVRGYGLEDRGVPVRIPVRSRIFSSPFRSD
jgi:hypothetical protein